MVGITECVGGIGLAENQVHRGTFDNSRPSQVGMIWRVSALGINQPIIIHSIVNK